MARLPAWLTSGRTRWYVAGTAAGLVLALLLTWILWPESSPAPRERRYRDVTACLLTGRQGIAEPTAAAVWAGMQDASLRTLAQAQFSVVREGHNPAARLAGLAQGNCEVILAVGADQVDAVAATAGRFPDLRFIVVDGQAAAPNISNLDGTGDLRASVSRVVESIVGPAPAN